MAKKKKAQKPKQTDWTSPPASPKTTPKEAVTDVPPSLPLPPAENPPTSTQDDPALSLAKPTESKTNETPTKEANANITQEPVAGNTPASEQKAQELSSSKGDEKGEPTPESKETASKEQKQELQLEPTSVPEPVSENAPLQVTKEVPAAPAVVEPSVPGNLEKKVEDSNFAKPDTVEIRDISTGLPISEKSSKSVESNLARESKVSPVVEEKLLPSESGSATVTKAESEPLPAVEFLTKSEKKTKKKKDTKDKATAVEVAVHELSPETAPESTPEPQSAPIEADISPPQPASVEAKSLSAPAPPIEAKSSTPPSAPVETKRSPTLESARSLPAPANVEPVPSPSPPTAALLPPSLVATARPPSPPEAAPSPPRSFAAPYSPRSVTTERPPAPIASPPKPGAVKQVIEENRPPAPSPPVTRARPRHVPAFDDDTDDEALIQPRLRGEALSRDSSRGSTYPPPQQSRSLFASRVPAEHYPNPAPHPPPPPPQYHHPRYYPPAAPPYYHGHNHNMSQSGGYPSHSGYGPPSHASHSSSPHGYQESWGHVPNYAPYGTQSPPQRHDSMGSREFGPPAIENGSAIEDDSGDVFSRIAQAIPDLHVLLAKYKETSGQLGVREELLRRASSEQQEKLRIKDEEIITLREKLGNLENKHSTDAGRLRLELGNLEEQVKELKEQLADTQSFKEEAGRLEGSLRAAFESLEAKYADLEVAHASLQKTSVEEMARTRAEFEEWKTTTTTRNDAEKIALAIQFDKKLKEADVAAEHLRQETAAAFVKEKDELRSEYQRQQHEREAHFDTMRKELETKLGASQLDCEHALKRERETMEVWSKERGTLVQAHREDIESLRKSWEEQRALLEGQHKKIKDESDKAWIDLHAEANRIATEHKALAEQLRKDKEELQKQYNDLRAENEKEKQIIKTVANNLDAEKSRLEKLMECYGDIAEIKSKGDTY
jgi:hypothetical protein